MRIGITGAAGFIGSATAAAARGHDIVRFSRCPGSGERSFGTQAPPDVSGLDAVVNLAGEPVMGWWTKEKKRRIQESRVLGTRRLVEALAVAKEGPRVLVNASAIGFYGDTGEREADEETASGEGFL